MIYIMGISLDDYIINRYEDMDSDLAFFEFETTPDFEWRKQWTPGYDHSLERSTEADPWNGEVFFPILILDRDIDDGEKLLIPDFFEVYDFTFASNRALKVLRSHDVKLQTFDCAVQHQQGQPPIQDSHKLYRLLEKQPVIDMEKSEVRLREDNPSYIHYFRNLVPTTSFLNSPSVMSYDTHDAYYVFIKDVLKKDIERVGLRGCYFYDFDKYSVWPRQERMTANTKNNNHTSSKSASATELTEHDQHEVENSQRIALEELNLTSDTDPKTIVQAIAQVVDSLVEGSLSYEDVMNCAVGYGCLYGEQICRHHNWQWRMVHYPNQSDPSLAVVTSDYAYVVHPMALVYDILASGKTNNLMLLFNLLGTEDKLPADRQQDGFVVLG